VNAATRLALDPRAEQNASAQRDCLITAHLHLVTAIASHIQRSIPIHMELEDLVHAGTMGLFEAATKYRDDMDVAFPSYAKHRIRGAILDSLRQQDWASRDLRKRYRQMESVKTELSAKLGRTPTDSEVAEAMGLNPRRWQALMVDFRNLSAAALQKQAVNEEQLMPEVPAAPTTAPDRMFARAELRSKIASALETLPQKYQQVVELYYERELTMKEIGNALGVNESRVSQIHKAALQLMQNALGSLGICSASAY
jgi:RNA polymerase sigma factor FliA